MRERDRGREVEGEEERMVEEGSERTKRNGEVSGIFDERRGDSLREQKSLN